MRNGCTWGWKNSFMVLSSTGRTDSSHRPFMYLVDVVVDVVVVVGGGDVDVGGKLIGCG